ncbi:MAG: TIGR04255 family protein [Chloroflexota bacterium]
MAFNLPSPPYVRFKRTPLRTVVFQVTFPPVLSISQPEYVAEFQERIRGDYPILEPGQRVAGQMILAAGDPMPPPPSVSATPLWLFLNASRDWRVTLATDFLAVQTTAYEDFRDFQSRVRVVLEALISKVSPGVQERLGLRYINEARHMNADQPSDWRKLLRPELIGIADQELLGHIDQSLQEIRVQLPDGHLVMKHGFFGADSLLKGPLYLLDFDCFDETTNPFQLDAILTKLASYNTVVHKVFRWVLQDSLFASFEPEDV